jgi:hypothetical protein
VHRLDCLEDQSDQRVRRRLVRLDGGGDGSGLSLEPLRRTWRCEDEDPLKVARDDE